MLTRKYDRQQLRALNSIWNAAGRYDIEPPFMAFERNGEADFYLNTMIGLCMKYYDTEEMNRFFLSYRNSFRKDTFDAVVWLALENVLYAKEIGDRPVLSSLRKEHARKLLEEMSTVSRQEVMVNNTSVYEQQEYRAKRILQESLPFLTPKAKRIAKKLEYTDTEADTLQVIDYLKDLLISEYRFSDFRMDIRDISQVTGPFRDMFRKILRHEEHRKDSLLTRNPYGMCETGVQGLFDTTVSSCDEADREYIEACFGPCRYSENERKQFENELCRGNHEHCAVWFSKGEEISKKLKNKESVLIEEQTNEQRKKNKAFFEKREAMIESHVRKLSAELETVLSSYMQALPVKAKSGVLISRYAYRPAILQDPYVFTKAGDEIENNLCVDILLDGSASRLQQQSSIASQAYILAKSLEKVNIPVRLQSFCSIRGFTVLELLKDYTDHDCMKIFRYHAAGWNRDGLALLSVARLMRKTEGKHIVLIMTDANPADSVKMPPAKDGVFLREYADSEAVRDTAETVKKLREEGIAVGAIFTGPSLYVDNAKRIYGNDWIRVYRMQDLAAGFGNLLQMLLRKMKD